MQYKGKVWIFGDHVDTDAIIPARFLNVTDKKVFSENCFIDLRPDFHGAVDSGDAIPGSFATETQLPYQQQLGSGTFDILPGVTASIQNEVASLGFQWKAEIRMGENDREWALGDLYKSTLWAGYNASERVSASVAVQYSRWGNVEGFDPALDAFANPANNTLAQGGWRVELPVGVNFIMPDGRFGGNRFGFQFILPVHQNLDGPQLMHDWSLVAGWQKAVSF